MQVRPSNRESSGPLKNSNEPVYDLTEWGLMRLADTHPEPGFPILPVRSGNDPKQTSSSSVFSLGEAFREMYCA